MKGADQKVSHHGGLASTPVRHVSDNSWRTGHGYQLFCTVICTGATRFNDFLAHRFISIYKTK
jgi:hypothetical protein